MFILSFIYCIRRPLLVYHPLSESSFLLKMHSLTMNCSHLHFSVYTNLELIPKSLSNSLPIPFAIHSETPYHMTIILIQLSCRNVSLTNQKCTNLIDFYHRSCLILSPFYIKTKLLAPLIHTGFLTCFYTNKCLQILGHSSFCQFQIIC